MSSTRLSDVSNNLRVPFSFPYWSHGIDPAHASNAAVFIIDSGLDRTHPNLKNACIVTCADVDNRGFVDWNTCHDTEGHGTSVASMLVGEGIGPAQGAQLHIIRIDGSEDLPEVAFETAIQITIQRIEEMRRANRNGASHCPHVGGPGQRMRNTAPPRTFIVNLSSTLPMKAGFRRAFKRLLEVPNVLLTAAAGNWNRQVDRDLHRSHRRLPSDLHRTESLESTSQLITVGAVDSNDNLMPGSVWGRYVTIFAPGQDVMHANLDLDATRSMRNRHSIYIGNGTSFSSPVVACVLALWVNDNPLIDSQQLRARLLQQALRGAVGGTPSGSQFNLLLHLSGIQSSNEEVTILADDRPVLASTRSQGRAPRNFVLKCRVRAFIVNRRISAPSMSMLAILYTKARGAKEWTHAETSDRTWNMASMMGATVYAGWDYGLAFRVSAKTQSHRKARVEISFQFKCE